MSGWIKLHRSLLDWEWYDDKNATRLLIHLLLSVNFEAKKWKGQTINAGSMVLSWDTLANATGLTKQQVRTAMQKLEESGEVTRKATNKWQLVALVKWDELQDGNTQITGNLTHKEHSNNTQITPTKEVKNNKNIRNKNIEERKADFKKSLAPFLDQYGKNILNEFYHYWTEANENGKKMRFEMQKTFAIANRLRTWAKNEKKFSSGPAQQKIFDNLRVDSGKFSEMEQYKIKTNQQKQNT